jgi:hypothetical protein
VPLLLEPLDELTFARAVQQMREARERGTNSRLLDNAYFVGGALANGDRGAGRVCSAAEVIEKVMTNSAAEIDTVAAALAGYYDGLKSGGGETGLRTWRASPPLSGSFPHLRTASCRCLRAPSALVFLYPLSQFRPLCCASVCAWAALQALPLDGAVYCAWAAPLGLRRSLRLGFS